jgi:pimeloyl-ACP methyl ester carboxylesterase
LLGDIGVQTRSINGLHVRLSAWPLHERPALTPPKYSRFLADHIRDAMLVAIPDAGHLSPVERPAAVNQAIREWLGEPVP